MGMGPRFQHNMKVLDVIENSKYILIAIVMLGKIDIRHILVFVSINGNHRRIKIIG